MAFRNGLGDLHLQGRVTGERASAIEILLAYRANGNRTRMGEVVTDGAGGSEEPPLLHGIGQKRSFAPDSQRRAEVAIPIPCSHEDAVRARGDPHPHAVPTLAVRAAIVMV